MARKWKEVVANLLTKAENVATTDHERQALIDKATELMLRFGIDEAEVRVKEDKPEEITSYLIKVTNPQKLKKQTLINGLANAFGCSAISLLDGEHVQVFGFPSDIEKVQTLYNSLIVQMFIALSVTVKPVGVHGKTYNSSFVNGFVLEVLRRIKNIHAKVREDIRKAPGTDLVLRNRDLEVKRAMANAFPNMRFRAGSGSHGTGFGDGTSAGQRADIGQTRLSGSVRAINGR